MKTIKGTELSGKKWLTRLEKGDYKISFYAKELILSKEFTPLPKKEYRIELILGKDVIGKTSDEIRALALSKGYEMPTAEVALLVREAISDDEMKELGICYIASLHAPIKDSGGGPGVLYSSRSGGGRWVDACWGNPGGQWSDGGAFAFPVLASTPNLESSTSESLPLTLTINNILYKRA